MVVELDVFRVFVVGLGFLVFFLNLLGLRLCRVMFSLVCFTFRVFKVQVF